jgi:hypothetical protein
MSGMTDKANVPDEELGTADVDATEFAADLNVSGDQVESGDAAFWATSGSRLHLHLGAAPQGAVNLNVEGRMVTSPIQGFGKMWQKTYRARLAGVAVAPAEVIRTWKAHFSEFWPAGNRFYAPITGLEPGDVALINMRMPGRTRLSTGVLVVYADDELFTLMTPQGHMLAGWITFSAYDDGGTTVAQVQVLIRASDPVYELALTAFAYRQEDRFWQHTLRQVAARFGVDAEPETKTLCIDSRRQWKRAGNIWHNAAIRTGVYTAITPVRWTMRSTRRAIGRRDG